MANGEIYDESSRNNMFKVISNKELAKKKSYSRNFFYSTNQRDYLKKEISGHKKIYTIDF